MHAVRGAAAAIGDMAKAAGGKELPTVRCQACGHRSTAEAATSTTLCGACLRPLATNHNVSDKDVKDLGDLIENFKSRVWELIPGALTLKPGERMITRGD